MRFVGSILLSMVLLLGAAGHGPGLSAAPAVTVIQVRDESGIPVAGVRVSARREKRSRPQFAAPDAAARGETDTTGKVSLDGLDPKQTYTLVATPADGHWDKYSDYCKLEWKAQDSTLTLMAANVLKGTVLTMKRAPVPYALVHVRIGYWQSATLADKNGAFEFKNAPPGTARLYAAIESKKDNEVRGSEASVPSDTHKAVVFVPAIPGDRRKHLIVRVRTPRGRPVMQAWATFSNKRKGPRNMGTSYSSSGSLNGCAARSRRFSNALTLNVSGARSEYGEPLPCGPAKAGPYPIGPREEHLALPVESFITGRILGPDSKPLVGIRIQARPKISYGGYSGVLGVVHGEDVSDAKGHFRVGGVDARAYTLQPVSSLDYVGGAGKCKGGAQQVELVMRAAAAPTLTCKDEAGQPVAGAVVRVRQSRRDIFAGDPNEWKLESETDERGQARLRGLDPQVKYLFNAYPPTELSELLTWEIKRWSPEDTALTFERRREISGIVRDQNKEPVPAARIQWVREEGTKGKPKSKPSKIRAGEDGTYVLKDLRPGRYSLVVRPPSIPRSGAGPAPSDAKFTSVPFVVRAGTAGVVLKIKMPDTITLRVWGWDKKVGKPTIIISARGDEGSGPKSLTKRVDKNGMLTVKGLRWNVSYALWMGDLKDGKYAYAPDVRPKAEKISMRVTEGKTVKGKFSSPKGTKARKVWAVLPGVRVTGKVKSGGRFEITGLPPGPWTLRGCGKFGKDLLESETSCKEGEEPVITLEAK